MEHLKYNLRIYKQMRLICLMRNRAFKILVFSYKHRMADLFTHNEADEIKDRKDKFKRYFFCKIDLMYEDGQVVSHDIIIWGDKIISFFT